MTIESTLLALDAARCAAIDEVDIPALAALMHDELTHVHQSGKVVDKREFLAGIEERPRRVTRQDVRVKAWEGAAVMTGVQVNIFEGRDPIVLQVTQLWLHESSGWRQVSFHCCKLEGLSK